MRTVALRSRQTWIGFTIGLVGTAALPFVVATSIDAVNGPRPEGGARRTKAMADIMEIREALVLYEREHGTLPSTEEGLITLVPEQLVKAPIDPWGHPYVYLCSSVVFC